MRNLLFTRVLVFSFLIYVLVRVAVSRDNAARVYRWCLSLAIVQLPIVLIQRLLYESMPTAIKVSVSRVDFGFGTFNLKGDAAMSFFVTMVVSLSYSTAGKSLAAAAMVCAAVAIINGSLGDSKSYETTSVPYLGILSYYSPSRKADC